MSLTNVKAPGGLSVNGNPIRDDIITTGTVFYVSSGTGSDGNKGINANQPLATIDAAINKCTADVGDVIYVMPGHAETISNATSLVPDIAGISIIGLGNGANAPEITFDDATSEIIVTGKSTLLRNLRFVAGVTAVVTGIDINVDNVTIDSCEFTFSGAGFDFVIFVDIDAFDYSIINNCVFRAENATDGASTGIRLDTADHIKILHCTFTGDFSLAPISQVTADAPGVNLLIADCIFYNDDTANADSVIALQEAYTGLIIRCVGGSLNGTSPEAAFVVGSCLSIENYIADVASETGTIVPLTIST